MFIYPIRNHWAVCLTKLDNSIQKWCNCAILSPDMTDPSNVNRNYSSCPELHNSLTIWVVKNEECTMCPFYEHSNHGSAWRTVETGERCIPCWPVKLGSMHLSPFGCEAADCDIEGYLSVGSRLLLADVSLSKNRYMYL